MLLARHLLTHRNFRTLALGVGFTGPRVLAHKTAQGVTERAGAAWREDLHSVLRSRAYEAIVARHGGGGSRIVAEGPRRALKIAHAMVRHVPPRGPSPIRAARHGAIYLNAIPLEWKRHVAWLDQRPDVKPVFWIHHLLAVERPEWFWGREPSLHAQRLDLLARRGTAAAVASAGVEASLKDYLGRRGRDDLPIFRLPPPVAPIFSTPQQFDERLTNAPFFLVCGTIEPRKNHLLVLRVWRDLIRKKGRDAPKLVVVGKRGWKNAEIVAALEDPALREHVIEVSGLPTPDYKRLLDHCRALGPFIGRGFWLPRRRGAGGRSAGARLGYPSLSRAGWQGRDLSRSAVRRGMAKRARRNGARRGFRAPPCCRRIEPSVVGILVSQAIRRIFANVGVVTPHSRWNGDAPKS